MQNLNDSEFIEYKKAFEMDIDSDTENDSDNDSDSDSNTSYDYDADQRRIRDKLVSISTDLSTNNPNEYGLDIGGMVDWFLNWEMYYLLLKFEKGTLTDKDVAKIYTTFDAFNESGSCITFMIISKKDDLKGCVEKAKKWLYNKMKEYWDNEGYDDLREKYGMFEMLASEERINKEVLYHSYMKIGQYYMFGINHDNYFCMSNGTEYRKHVDFIPE
jgi:hypothetical protein